MYIKGQGVCPSRSPVESAFSQAACTVSSVYVQYQYNRRGRGREDFRILRYGLITGPARCTAAVAPALSSYTYTPYTIQPCASL